MTFLDWMRSWQAELTFGILFLVGSIFYALQGDVGLAVVFFVLAVGNLLGAWTRWHKARNAHQER